MLQPKKKNSKRPVTNLERTVIDEQFVAMLHDIEYQDLNETIASEFEESGWEALLAAETD